jgi:hypothetical protein
VSESPSNGLLEKLAVADRPGGAAMALPLSWDHQGGPTQLVGSPADGGISTASAAMEQQMDQPATAAGQQLSGDALMGPEQVAAACGGDHKRANRGLACPEQMRDSHENQLP